jgi:hypothetical protein
LRRFRKGTVVEESGFGRAGSAFLFHRSTFGVGCSKIFASGTNAWGWHFGPPCTEAQNGLAEEIPNISSAPGGAAHDTALI